MLRLIGNPAWNSPFAKNALFRSLDANLGPRVIFDGSDYYLNTRDLPPGTYPLQYIFTNTENATDTLTRFVVVNAAPEAVIEVPNSCIEDLITFVDGSHVPQEPARNIVSWAWTYGEGGHGNDGVSRNPTYRYTSEGFKTLTLRVTTDQGCVHETSKTIRVSNPPKPDFTWSKICVETETTEFRDLSDPGIGTIIQYAWKFSDNPGDTLGYGIPTKPVPPGKHGGRTSNTYKDPHHRYLNFQTYNVVLSIKTDDGCESSVTKRVYILDYGKPTPTSGYFEDFEAGPGTWVPTSSHLAAGKVNQFSWVFGTPAGATINGAASGQNAWWTGGNPDADSDYSTYYPNDSTEVTGP